MGIRSLGRHWGSQAQEVLWTVTWMAPVLAHCRGCGSRPLAHRVGTPVPWPEPHQLAAPRSFHQPLPGWPALGSVRGAGLLGSEQCWLRSGLPGRALWCHCIYSCARCHLVTVYTGSIGLGRVGGRQAGRRPVGAGKPSDLRLLASCLKPKLVPFLLARPEVALRAPRAMGGAAQGRLEWAN